MKRRLVMFDIDGTLTATYGSDTDRYARIVSAHLGAPISQDWSSYRNVTDSGIATELLERHGRPASELAVIRERFVKATVDALRVDPGMCREVAGAASLLRFLPQVPGVVVALATGGWDESARAKLRCAGIDIGGLCFASADDARSRTQIMAICHQRCLATGVELQQSVYVGDGLWDLQAARELGWGFVGVGVGPRAQALRRAGARNVFADLRDHDAFLAAVLAS